MVNEFHNALINKRFTGTSPGTDHVPEGWEPRLVSSNAKAIQRVLLVKPTSSAACNWRAIEIRRLLEKSDFANYLQEFDARTGYLLDDLVRDMVQYYRPRVVGSSASARRVKVNMPYTAATYELSNWTIDVVGNNWSITSVSGQNSGTVDGEVLITDYLPGTEITVTFPTDTNYNFVLTWAAKPTTTIADTAKELSALFSQVNSLSQEPSVFSSSQVSVLRNTVMGKSEPSAKVAAASLLFAGTVLTSPEGTV